jgi:predicted phage terminase large subunit-like protein
VFDDVVTRESVTTPEMIGKTTSALELAFNLGSQGQEWRRMIGTRYHFNDTYKAMMDRGTFKPRLHPATIDGTIEGDPVLLSRELLEKKRRDMGPYTFACQMMQNPVADQTQGFKREWLRHYDKTDGGGMNKYMLVDAANDKRKSNDYTAIWIIGLAADQNYYVLDMVRDRLNLTERTETVIRLHKKWRPQQVRYERYGMMADISHLKYRQNETNYRFEVTEVGGSTPKNDRIRRLIPLFEQGTVYLPHTLHYTDYEKIPRDLVHAFIEEEYAAFPVSIHDDMLDALARICEPDLTLTWPKLAEEPKEDRYRGKSESRSSWV